MKKKLFKVLALVMVVLMQISIVSYAATPEARTTGNITIHKYKVSDIEKYKISADGNIVDPDAEIAEDGTTLSDLEPLANIYFKLTEVKLKEGKTAGSTNIDDYDVVTTFEPVATDEFGEIIWPDLPFGIYYIEEIANNTAEKYSPPFFVNLPMTNPAKDGFIYDVHIYPKNEVTGPDIDKEFIEPAPETGSNIIKWKISVDIADDIKDAQKLVITDKLDERLEYLANNIRGYYTDRDGNEGALTEDTHFTVSYPETDNTMVITITPEGFEALAGALTGEGDNKPTLYFEFGTMIILDNGDEETTWNPIINDAVLDFTNSDGHEYGPKSPVEPPSTNPYGIIIEKVDENDRPLAGAKFKIYPTEEDAKNRTNALKDPNNEGHINDWEVTTAELTGVAEFNGLSYGTYWLVETAVPAGGYNLLLDPIEVVISETETLSQITIKVENHKGFMLPSTGGNGTFLYTVGGCLLLAAGIIVVILSGKKKINKKDL